MQRVQPKINQQESAGVSLVVIAVITAFLFLSACNAEEVTPTPDPTEEPAAVTVAPTEAATAVPTDEPTPEPTVEPESTPAPSTGSGQAVYEEASCEFDIPEGRDVTCGWLTVQRMSKKH